MTTVQESEHPVLVCKNLNTQMKNRAIRRPVLMLNSSVVDALSNVSSRPFVSFTLGSHISRSKFMGSGETSFGTIGDPDIEAIRSKSTPSSFGKGEQTVTDPTYRNGHEIKADDIKRSTGHHNLVYVSRRSHSTLTSKHKVEPVTEGARLVLQYNVAVTDKSSRSSTPDPDEEDLQESFLDAVVLHSSKGCDDHDEEPQAPFRLSQESSLPVLVNAIHEIIDDGKEEIGIPLRDLYRQASIRKEYLKGIDADIYARLGEVFKVELVPIILEGISVEGNWTREDFSAFKVVGEINEEDRSPIKRTRSSTEFHLSVLSDIVEIPRRDLCAVCPSRSH